MHVLVQRTPHTCPHSSLCLSVCLSVSVSVSVSVSPPSQSLSSSCLSLSLSFAILSFSQLTLSLPPSVTPSLAPSLTKRSADIRLFTTCPPSPAPPALAPSHPPPLAGRGIERRPCPATRSRDRPGTRPGIGLTGTRWEIDKIRSQSTDGPAGNLRAEGMANWTRETRGLNHPGMSPADHPGR